MWMEMDAVTGSSPRQNFNIKVEVLLCKSHLHKYLYPNFLWSISMNLIVLLQFSMERTGGLFYVIPMHIGLVTSQHRSVFRLCRAQRARVNEATSDWWPVTRGVLQGLNLSLVLFNILINDLETSLEGILRKFAGDTNLGDTADSLQNREALQRLQQIRGLGNHQPCEIQWEKVIDSAPGMGQPLMYRQTGKKNAKNSTAENSWGS